MDAPATKTETATETPLAKIFEKLGTSPKGLSASEAEKRLEKYGYNAIAEKKVNPLLKFLGYFWGPIPWMIEVAAVLSAIVRHWADFIIIIVLLAFNGLVGFWQEYQAGNAVEALKKKLALKSRALRDGHWQPINAKELVPGDIIRLRLGDIIPADVMLFEGEYLSVDQSALTGESLPVNKTPGDSAYSGSIAKQGEMLGLVTATGNDTYFGKTAKLVAQAKPVSHFQKAVLQIGDYLIYLSLASGGGPCSCPAVSRHRPARAGSVRFDPDRGLHPGGHAGRAFRHHGGWCPGAFQTEGHRLPSGID